jgi:hypothetical protein
VADVEKGTKAVICVNSSACGKRRFNNLRANFVREIPRKEFFNTHARQQQLSINRKTVQCLFPATAASRTPPWPASGLRVSKEFVVVLPVSLKFKHDALKFSVSAQLVPVFVAPKPWKIMISNLYGSSQPSDSGLLFA